MLISQSSSRLLICLFLLSTVLLVQDSQGQTWPDFQNKHIADPPSHDQNPNAYCNLLMMKRKPNSIFCKPINTFINDSPNSIKQVCKGQAIPWKRFFNSTSYFNMIDCHLTGDSPPNDCKYKGSALIKGICVACENGLPVHLEALYPNSVSGKPTENCVLFYLMFFYPLAMCWQFGLF